MLDPRPLAGALLLVVISGGGVLLAANQQPASTASAPMPDVTKLGPQIGERVPSFALPDQHGRRHSLESLMGQKGLVLVFFRSADW
jgi:hypothetical protein